MRRKTVELDKDLLNHKRKVQKNFTYKCIQRPSCMEQQNFTNKFTNYFVSSQAIITLVLEDLFHSLENTFRKLDQKRYEKDLSLAISTIQDELAQSLNPIHSLNLVKEGSSIAEKQPLPIESDWICGGAPVHCKWRQPKGKHPSILDCERPYIKDSYLSKKLLSECVSQKCLTQLPKDQQLQRKKSFLALNLQPQQLNNEYQELVRQKVFKQTAPVGSNAFKPVNRFIHRSTLNKNQFSYDYDGSAILLKKLSKQNLEAVNVLNNTCKIINKDLILNPKGAPITKSKVSPYHSFKTEMGETAQEELFKLIATRKQSTLDSLNNMAILNRQDQEQQWKSKFQQLAKIKAIRIRQIKQN